MKKNLTIGGRKVEVEDFDSTAPGKVPSRRVVARVGESQVEMSITFGADEARPPVSAAALNGQLEETRRQAAQEAVWQQELKEMAAGLN